MRSWFWLGLALMLAGTIGAGLSGAADKAHARPTPGKYKVHDIEHHEREFDTAKEDHKKELLELIEKDEVVELERIKDPPNPISDIKYDLGLWSIVIFVVLLFILRKLAWGPMLEGLKKREDSIRLAVDEAKLAREETERLRAQFQAEMDQAFAKIPQLMDEARRQGEKLVEDMRSKATAEIQADRQRLRRELDLARDQALQELWNQAAQLATLISVKAIGRSLSPEDHNRLVDEALTEIRQTVHK